MKIRRTACSLGISVLSEQLNFNMDTTDTMIVLLILKNRFS
uniref:Transposase n=1 Tax=Ascaris lumbricoides TaxID=6252 RepID=A0A0M3ILI4_ASCLU